MVSVLLVWVRSKAATGETQRFEVPLEDLACHAVLMRQDEFASLLLFSRLGGSSTRSTLFLQDDQLAVGLSSEENLLNALSNSAQSGISIVPGIIRCLSKINRVKNGTSRLGEVPYFLDIGYT